MKDHMSAGPHMITFILVIIGGLNWLIFGIFGQEIGTWIGGMDTVIARVIYVVIGLAAVYEIATHKKHCKSCQAMKGKKTESSSSEDTRGSGGSSDNM
jgi:uncharacterized protein